MYLFYLFAAGRSAPALEPGGTWLAALASGARPALIVLDAATGARRLTLALPGAAVGSQQALSYLAIACAPTRLYP